MDKSYEIQRAARENVDNYKSYITDLNNWEREMKRKEAALRGDTEQDLPPVRSKIKKDKPIAKVTHKKPDRPKSCDYQAWDKFDVDAACEAVDMSSVGPASLDARRSADDKQGKLREEAQHEKDRGNTFVKQEKWNEAVQCYNRAIELINNDAIYYANRGLCYLKLEKLHQAETDCTEAIKLDQTYVKAYQRRAVAREKLQSLRAASHDLAKILQLEPNNAAAKRQLAALKERMATKGGKFKSSPVTTPTEAKAPAFDPSPKIIELPDEPPKITEVSTKVFNPERQEAEERWVTGTGDGVTVIQPVYKPPHLRSKKPLRVVPIGEVCLGDAEPPLAPPPHTQRGKGDCPDKTSQQVVSGVKKPMFNLDTYKILPPTNCVQFSAEWRTMADNDMAKRAYLNVINPAKLPSIFQNSLESDALSDILRVLATGPLVFKDRGVKEYLRALTSVKRFSALAMFLGENDKNVMKSLLQHCREVEGCSEDELNDLRNKFEL